MWRRALCACYYRCTLPARRLADTRRRASGSAPVMVLFYHRVADFHPNAWTSPYRTFVAQMIWLRKHFDLVSLAEAQRRIESCDNPRPCVSVTFDDGYADNCRTSIPWMIKHDVPCTYFVASRHILDREPFAHDVAAGQPLAANSEDDLRRMASRGVEIGAHTRTHADLGRCATATMLVDEIGGSKRDLERVLDCEVRFFAFPYGQPHNMSAAAFDAARDVGYRGVCSAYGGYNVPGQDAFHLRRIHADADTVFLKNWLTVDPRKQRMVRQWERGLEWLPAAGPRGSCSAAMRQAANGS